MTSPVDAVVASVLGHLKAGAPRGTHAGELRRALAGSGSEHDYDELIDSLFVFLGALVRARAADLYQSSGGGESRPAASAGQSQPAYRTPDGSGDTRPAQPPKAVAAQAAGVAPGPLDPIAARREQREQFHASSAAHAPKPVRAYKLSDEARARMSAGQRARQERARLAKGGKA